MLRKVEARRAFCECGDILSFRFVLNWLFEIVRSVFYNRWSWSDHCIYPVLGRDRCGVSWIAPLSLVGFEMAGRFVTWKYWVKERLHKKRKSIGNDS